MIDLLFATSPNVYKIAIALEEISCDYQLTLPGVDGFGAQSPTGKIPVIVDHDPPGGGEPLVVFESGAILQYLAEKYSDLIPADLRGRLEVIQWLNWQVSGLGPFSGQAFHFRSLAPLVAPEVENGYSRSRYENMLVAHWRTLERQLEGRDYICGAFSIVDAACWPWIDYICAREGSNAGSYLQARRWFESDVERAEIRGSFPNIAKWHERVGDRPGVVAAYARCREVDIGKERNAMGTIKLTADELRQVITL